MLLYYLITKLKPVALDKPVPMSSAEFLATARDCCAGPAAMDVELLGLYLSLDRALREMAHARHRGLNYEFEGSQAFGLLNNYHLETFYKRLSSYEPESLRRLYWHMLMHAGRDAFIRDFAREAVGLFEALAQLLTHKQSSNSVLVSTLSQALAHEDPLVLERRVARYVFELADSLAGLEASPSQVYAYFFKLVMCERLAGFDEDRGRQILNSLIETIHQGAKA